MELEAVKAEEVPCGPLPGGVPADVQSPNGGRKRARQVALETVKAKDADAEEADGDKTNQKMVAAMEKANALAEDRMSNSDLRKQLLMLRKKSLSMAASDDGSG